MIKKIFTQLLVLIALTTFNLSLTHNHVDFTSDAIQEISKVEKCDICKLKFSNFNENSIAKSLSNVKDFTLNHFFSNDFLIPKLVILNLDNKSPPPFLS